MLLIIVFGLIGLGIMVFVHELGHFLAAKANGVEVEVFSLGWGRKLVGFTHRGTSYQLSWFPLGGYCKMKGDDALREARRLGSSEYQQEPGSFFAAAAWRRISIVVAGPVANLLFAVVVLSIIWWAGFRIDTPGNRIILASDYNLDAVPANAPATAAGLQTGDRVIAINGATVRNFQELRERVATAPERALSFVIERDSNTLTTTVTPELDTETLSGRIWVYPWVDPVVRVRPQSPASMAGLRNGDLLVAVDGQPVRHSIDVITRLDRADGGLQVTAERDGAQFSTQLVLGPAPAEGQPVDPGFGFVIPEFRSPQLSPVQALGRGLDETGRTIGLTVSGFGLLFRGNAQNAVAGPLRLTYYVGRAATDGFDRGVGAGLVQFFRLLCLISIVLFLMNLLPLPALDGGHIVLYIIEAIRRRPVPPAVVYRIQTFGFSLLLVVALTITFSDILFFVGR